MARITLKTVNKAIEAKFPKVRLEKGKGYFYIYSDDDEMALKIAGLHTTSIYCYQISQQSVERWVGDVEILLKDKAERGSVTGY